MKFGYCFRRLCAALMAVVLCTIADAAPETLAQSPSITERSQRTLLGDMNGDGRHTPADEDAFTLAMLDPDRYQDRYQLLPEIVGDLTGDGRLTAADTDAFRALMDNPPANRPNIVFIMADDMGYRHLGCYGQERIQTPNIDRLAEQGLRFTQHYSGCTVCGPSRAVLMSGMHNGHIPYRRNAASAPLRNETLTLMELLKQAGYTTGCFGKWGIGELGTDHHPNRQGVDEFLGLLHQGHGHAHYPPYLWHNDEQQDLGNRSGHPFRSSTNPEDRVKHSHDAFMDGALQFIRDNQDEPFFCYIPLTLVHTEVRATEEAVAPYRQLGWPEYTLNNAPYHLPTNEPRVQFAGMLSMVDDSVGDVMALLEELGLDENTVVIFTSDNGGQLREVWGNAPSIWFDANGELRGGKQENYEGGIRVPLIVRWPGVTEAGAVTDHISYFPDWMPTLAQVAGIREPEGLDGITFGPTLRTAGQDISANNTAQRQHTFLYWEHLVYNGDTPHLTHLRQAVRMGRWKGVRERTTDALELYDLESDISETNNVASQHPGVVRQIEQILSEQHLAPEPSQPSQFGTENK